MINLQSLLGLDKSNPLFEVLVNPNIPNELLVHYGMHLLEKVRKGGISEKLLAARLYNSGFSRMRLRQALGFDNKTMRRWGRALIDGDAERIVHAFAGQGAERRMTPMLERYVRVTYQEIADKMGCHSNEFIRKELREKFDQEFCHESIRRILRNVDEKMKPSTSCTTETTTKSTSETDIAPAIKTVTESIHETTVAPTTETAAESIHETAVALTTETAMESGTETVATPTVETAPKSSNDVAMVSAICTTSISVQQDEVASIQDTSAPVNDITPVPVSSVDSELPCVAIVHAAASTVDDALSILATAVGGGIDGNSQEEQASRENNCDCSDLSSTNSSKNCNNSPCQEDVAPPQFPTLGSKKDNPRLCHHAGLTLCRILIDGVTSGLGNISDIIRQWIAMILCGCMNIENGRSLNYPALEIILGKQMWSSNTQREILHAIAKDEVAQAILHRNIRMVGAELSSTFLYDPHSIEYTGQLQILKGWLGGSHKVGKAYYQDFIHTTDGEPVFLNIDDNRNDMRVRFIANIDKFRMILGGDTTRELTIVVDRAIYDVGYLIELREKHGIFIITWEKNYCRGQWKTIDKKDIRQININFTRNDVLDTYTHTVSYVRRSWPKEPSFTQFIIMLAKPGKEPVELSVIYTGKNTNDVECLIPIIRRWLQENDFSFLDRLGINELTSYKSFSYEEIADSLDDRIVANSERKWLCAGRLSLKKDLGLALVAVEEFEKEVTIKQLEFNEAFSKIKDDAAKKPEDDKEICEIRRKHKASVYAFERRRKSFSTKNMNLQVELRKEIAEINVKIDGEEETVSRLEKLIEDKYKKLNFMPKTIMDCVKIVARNIIYKRMESFRPIYDNRRNDHVILRELMESVGFIHENATTIVVTLYPSRHYPLEVRGKIKDFLLSVSIDANRFYKPGKTIVFKLHDT